MIVIYSICRCFEFQLRIVSVFSQDGANDGIDKEQAFHPDLTPTFNRLHIPPRCPKGV
jgi:hypothetical protein